MIQKERIEQLKSDIAQRMSEQSVSQLRYFQLINFLNEQIHEIDIGGEDDFRKLYLDLTDFIFNKL